MKRSFSGLPSGFLKLWIGQTVSEFGSRITRAGIPLIAVITLTASPSQMAVLAAVGSIPVLLFGLFAGVWVDRLRRRPILIVADLLRAGLLLTLPLAAHDRAFDDGAALRPDGGAGDAGADLRDRLPGLSAGAGRARPNRRRQQPPIDQRSAGRGRRASGGGAADPDHQRAAGRDLRRADLPVFGHQLIADPPARSAARAAQR